MCTASPGKHSRRERGTERERERERETERERDERNMIISMYSAPQGEHSGREKEMRER